jgi:cytochrome c oxidase subunit 4
MSDHAAEDAGHVEHGGHGPRAGHGGHAGSQAAREGDFERVGHGDEHGHPTAKKYLAIAAILTVLTMIEVAVFYIPEMRPILPPILLVMSALKFAIVAMFYMHLKFDHKLFSWLFVVPMALAAAVILALMLLFGVFRR